MSSKSPASTDKERLSYPPKEARIREDPPDQGPTPWSEREADTLLQQELTAETKDQVEEVPLLTTIIGMLIRPNQELKTIATFQTQWVPQLITARTFQAQEEALHLQKRVTSATSRSSWTDSQPKPLPSYQTTCRANRLRDHTLKWIDPAADILMHLLPLEKCHMAVIIFD